MIPVFPLVTTGCVLTNEGTSIDGKDGTIGEGKMIDIVVRGSFGVGDREVDLRGKIEEYGGELMNSRGIICETRIGQSKDREA